MQYHITERVRGREWEQEQASIIDELRRRAQHDLEAQNPGSTVTIDAVHHTVRTSDPGALPTESDGEWLIDFVCEYTVSGQVNTFAA